MKKSFSEDAENINNRKEKYLTVLKSKTPINQKDIVRKGIGGDRWRW